MHKEIFVFQPTISSRFTATGKPVAKSIKLNKNRVIKR